MNQPHFVYQERSRVLALLIPEGLWTDADADTGFRYGPLISINGALHHLTAIPVTTDIDGQVIGETDLAEHDMAAMQELNEGSYETIELGAKTYVLHMTPLAD